MEPSPFTVNGPLDPADLRGRDRLLADLVGRVTARRPTALIGPRRYGKTSVLRRLAADLTEVSTVWVDLWGAVSVADVATAIDDGIAAAGPALTREGRTVAATLGLDLGVLRATISRPAAQRPDYGGLLPGLLRVLTTAAAHTPVLLVLDEFSAIATMPDVVAKLRTGLQHHYRDLGIVFAGSEPSTMMMMFTDRAEPFYSQADRVHIGPLDRTDAVMIVADGFDRTGRDAGLTGPRSYDLTGGHPYRLMQAADAVWTATPHGSVADDTAWADGIEELRRGLDEGFRRLHNHLPLGQQRVLRLVANGASPHGQYADVLDLTRSTATQARNALVDSGDLQRDPDRTLRINDPLLADWLRRTFPL